jgi:two-component system, LytTR family, response regulator AlgR
VKILIVDDESLARDRLQRLVQKISAEAECLQASGGEAALDLVAEQSPDIVLLDIRMPGLDGIGVAAELDKMDSPPAVIFCTAYDDHALEALQHQVEAYLLKPVREADLARALDSAGRVNRLQLASMQDQAVEPRSERTHVTAQSHRGLESLALAEIRCFLAEDKYVTACAPEGNLVIQESLKELEEELHSTFVRVHRSALVALAHVVSLQKEGANAWSLELDGVAVSPLVSRRHMKEVKDRLKSR